MHDYPQFWFHFMNQFSGNKGASAFAKSVEKLIATEFADLSLEDIGQVLDELGQRYLMQALDASKKSTNNRGAQQDSGLGWSQQIDKQVIRPLTPSDSHLNDVSKASVFIEAETQEHIHSLLYQALHVGAILLDLQSGPPLNSMVDVSLAFPHAHLTVETSGRVVHVSERGTAIEVFNLNKEDLAAMQAMYNQMMEPAVELAQNVSPETTINRMEVGMTLSSNRPRRRMDLPSPDESILNVTGTTLQSGMEREFYGPALPWHAASGDPDRIEDLAQDRIVDMLLQLSESGFTGIMEVRSPEVARQVYFDGGYVTEIRRKQRLAAEELGPMLQAADQITHHQLAMAAAHADEFGFAVERSLMELGIVDAGKIRHGIAGRLTYLLREICGQEVGQVRVYGSQSLEAGFLPQPPLRVHVAVERIVFERLSKQLRELPARERERIIGAEIDSYPEIVAQDSDRLELAVVQPQSQELLERVVTGRRRLREVFTESGLSPVETFAVLFALHRMGLLRFDRSLHETVVRERVRENITVKYLSVHKASYFEVLNIHWSSYDEVVEKAYQDLIVQFDPDKIPAELEEEVHKRVGEIRERIELAYTTLRERSSRHTYRMRIMPEYKLAHAVPLFLKQAELAERRSQWAEARDGLRRVLEIEPDNSDGTTRLKRLASLGVVPEI